MYTTVARVRSYLGSAYDSTPTDAVVTERIYDAQRMMDARIRRGGGVPPTGSIPSPVETLATYYAALLVLESSGSMNTARQERLGAEVAENLQYLQTNPGAYGVSLQDATMYYADDPDDPQNSELGLP